MIVSGAGSWLRATGSWLGDRIRRTLQLGIIGGMVAAGYGITQFGCRNDAITYAHAIYKGASCVAIETHWLPRDGRDSAVCRFKAANGFEVVVRCVAGDPPICKDVFLP